MLVFTEHVLAWLGCGETCFLGDWRQLSRWVAATPRVLKLGLIMIWLAMAGLAHSYPSMSNGFRRHPDCEENLAFPVTPETRLLGFWQSTYLQTYSDPSQNLWQKTGKGTAHICLYVLLCSLKSFIFIYSDSCLSFFSVGKILRRWPGHWRRHLKNVKP